jgi:hypothetical protein
MNSLSNDKKAGPIAGACFIDAVQIKDKIDLFLSRVLPGM